MDTSPADISSTDSSPKDNSLKGQFPEQTFSDKHFPERTLPRITFLFIFKSLFTVANVAKPNEFQ